MLEIIETYWNVNGLKRKKKTKLTKEIIETYWNVNVDYFRRVLPATKK